MKHLVLVVLMSAACSLTYVQVRLQLNYSTPVVCSGLEGLDEFVNDRGHLSNVTAAELIVYNQVVNSHGKKTAVLVVPGGAYREIAIGYEGYKTAEWLNANGIIAAILKYRLPNGVPEVAMQDITAAMSIFKRWATDNNIDKVGIIGFSAGGHLASIAMTLLPGTLRPDYAVLVYPVISMKYYNSGTVRNLLGVNPHENTVEYYSMENNVDSLTPPTFIVLTADDKAVDPLNGIGFHNALIRHSVMSQMFVFPEGNHGWWMRDRYKYGDITYTEILKWIQSF